MIKFYFLFIASLICSPNLLFAQSDLPEWGVFDSEELNMKECSFDKNAGAVILFDDAFSTYDDDYQLITTRRIRIKILNERGIDEGNIRIQFYSGDDFEYIKDISAVTYIPNDNGSFLSYPLDRKSIFTEKENEYFSSIKFAMPNVKAGSIIEYKYTSVKKHYGGLKNWEFQSYLPILKSCYLLQIIPGVEFAYFVQKKKTYPIVIRPKPDAGQIYFEMSDIPGLKEEPYMDAPKDYLQRVEFQFSGYTNTFGSKQDVNTTWRQLAYDLATNKSFGGVLKKSLPQIDDIKNLVAKETTETGKLVAIYNYVRDNFTADGFYGIYADDGLKGVWEQRKGDASEINFILINLLQTFNIETHPLLVAERDFGKIDTLYPLVSRFNKTDAYAIADGTIYIMDATQKYCPAWLVPYPILNTYAFLVDSKKYKLFRIESNDQSYKNDIKLKAKIDEKGILSGTAEITSDEYSKQMQSEKTQDNKKGFINKVLLASREGLSLDSFECENLKNDSVPLVQHFLFADDLNESGGFVLLNCNMFTGLEKNPFTKPERFTNIDFGFPYNINVEEDIDLPDNSKIDELPKNVTLVTPDHGISVNRQIKQTENHLQIRIEFHQTTTLVPVEYYDNIKQFYQSMTDMLNEPLTIKLGN